MQQHINFASVGGFVRWGGAVLLPFWVGAVMSGWHIGAIAQVNPAPIRSAQDGTGTRVNRETDGVGGDRFIIEGGTPIDHNLFHSFEEFGLSANQIASFLADSEVRNILSRVVGGDASIINGLIEVVGSDANLYLMNPAGIVFGPDSRLNVAGDFTATTATGIGFEGGVFDAVGEVEYGQLVGDPTGFVFATTNPGAVVNSGHLSVASGSSLTLLGGTVVNTGTLSAPGGAITIAAVPGDRLVRISQEGMLLSLEVEPMDGTVTSPGLPFTPLTLPELLTGHGLTAATAITVNEDGTISLSGGNARIPVEPGTAIAAGTLDVFDGENGGMVGEWNGEDRPDASHPLASFEGDSPDPRAPEINVLGDRVAVINAVLDASSAETPGTIRIGGGFQGQDTVPNAQLTYVNGDSVLRADGADGTGLGQSRPVDGGTVVVWADDTTQFYGSARAQGSETGGDGGLVEISGRGNLTFDGLVDVGALNGASGTVLFDPKDISIVESPTFSRDAELQPDIPTTGDPEGAIFFNDNPADQFDISAGAIAAINGDVTLQASNTINVEGAIASTTLDNLVLQAGQSIFVDAPIELTNGNFLARINDEGADPVNRIPGDAFFSVFSPGAIITENGDITVEVGTFGGTPIGTLEFLGANVLARNGSITLTGFGGTSGEGSSPGVVLDSSTIQALDAGSITLRGTAGGTFSDFNAVGVDVGFDSAIQATGTASILIEGTAGDALTNNIGVDISGAIQAEGGDITIGGISENGVGGNDNYGIRLQGGSIVNTGDGAIALNGTVGEGLSGTFNTSGIGILGDEMALFGSTLTVENGTLSLTGRNAAAELDNPGIRINLGSSLMATGDGEILLTGEAAADVGILLDGGSINAGTSPNSRITVTADEIDWVNGAQVQGQGTLEIQPLTPSASIQLGGARPTDNTRFTDGDHPTDGHLALTTDDLSTVQTGFRSITLGRTDGSGAIALISDMTFADSLTLRSPIGTGSINTTGGRLQLNDDASLILLANQAITLGNVQAPGNAITAISTNGAIDTTAGTLDTRSLNSGGDVTLTAAGTMAIGDITTRAVGTPSDGGSIDAGNAGAITINSTARSVTIQGTLDTTSQADFNAARGGRIEIGAVDTITVTDAGILTTSTRSQQGNAASAGDIILSAGNSVQVNTRLDTTATAFQGSAVRGGTILIDAGQDIQLQNGVDSSIVAGQGTAGAGNIQLNAGNNITVQGLLDSSAVSTAGLSGNGGRVSLTAGNDISVESIDTSAEAVSQGGAIQMVAPGRITMNAEVLSDNAGDRSGGSVNIQGGDGVFLTLTPLALNGSPATNTPTRSTRGERFGVRSQNGPVELVGTTPIRIATEGGNLRLQGTAVTTDNILLDTSLEEGDGGAMRIIATDGAIAVGNLDSSGRTGGNIRIESSVSITAGRINTSGSIGNGGNVTLDPPGDIEVVFINAEGGDRGRGGDVDITTDSFFRATDTFRGGDRRRVSISTLAGRGTGDITIRHGGNGETPFVVGDAELNGTAGAITSGEVDINPVRSFPLSYEEGSRGEGRIRILTGGNEEPEPPPPPLPDPTPIPTDQVVTAIETSDSSPELPDVPLFTPLVYLTPLTYDFDTVETIATEEFTEYFGGDAPLEITIDEAQDSLRIIERDTGIKPAILYAFFVPAPVNVQVPDTSENEGPPHPNTLQTSGRDENTGDQIEPAWVASLPSSVNNHPTDIWIPLLAGQGFNDLDTLIAQASLEREPEPTDELELILVTADSVVRRRIGGATRARVQETADQLRNQVTHPRRTDEYLEPAQTLYHWLVSPVEPELTIEEIGNIAFVMDVGLRSLPIAALHTGDQFIIERYSVGLMPTLTLTDTRYADVRTMDVLAMGAEQFSDLPPLPAVPLELEAITEDIWDGVAFINDDFTVTNLQGERRDRPYGIVHLATHGEFQPGSPQNSYIQFGSQRLDLTDLPDLSLNNPPVELLVLSACRTALGDREAELGFAGLALQAGVKSALASLWYVSDVGALAIMTEFYQELRRSPIKAEALRQAQLDLLQGNEQWVETLRQDARSNPAFSTDLSEITTDQLRHPYYWSAFTIIGSPW